MEYSDNREVLKMARTILGSYDSKEEAITAVDVHALTGFSSSNITIFTNEINARQLENYTSVSIKTNSPQEKEDKRPPSIFERILNSLSGSDDFDLHSEENLMDFGLSKEEAKQCMRDAQNGKIVILANDELRMGHQEETENASFH